MGAEDDRYGPAWDDPVLMLLAAQLRTAHQRISPLPRESRQRLHRQLLAITDLAKRDHELAARRLSAFIDTFIEADDADVDAGPTRS